MKLGSLAAARPALYDRNATSQINSGTYNVGPHALTTRITVTVATGKKLLLETLNYTVARLTAATLVGEYQAYWQVTSGANSAYLVSSPLYSNTVALIDRVQLATQTTIYVGETLTMATYDGSTGGTVSYGGNLKGTIFDA